MADPTPSDPRQALSAEALAALEDVDDAELRALISSARKRRRHVHAAATDEMTDGLGEEIVRVEERPGFVEVLNNEPCEEDCAESPHVPEEYEPHGDVDRYWTDLGRVEYQIPRQYGDVGALSSGWPTRAAYGHRCEPWDRRG
jgi:hypothetical protein